MDAIDPDEEWRLLIDGEAVATADTYDIVDPSTTAVVGRAPDATTAQALDAAAAARAALPGWRDLPSEARGALLARLADELEQRSPAWVPLVQAETGATIKITRSLQVSGAFVDRFRYYSRPVDLDEAIRPAPAAASALGPAGLLGAHVIRQPVGVVAAITPYNFPLTNVAGKIAPALAMGNTVVIKPAPQDPLGVLRLGEVVSEVLPPGVVNIVSGSGPEAGAALVDSPDVDMISFTGSTRVGTAIYENGAKTMKRLLMELGGKGALVMTEDADIGQAVGAVASVWGFHSGQICTAPTRVICHRSIYDETVSQLQAVAGMLKVGDPLDPDTLVGPVITEAHRSTVEGFVTAGVQAGATLLAGGERPERPGWFVAPALLADCTPAMDVVREEIFGPVVVVIAHGDDDEAIAIANDSDYGLFSYVFAGDTSRAYSLARRIESGNVALNCIQPHMEAPFGGFKRSGIGRDRGVYGLHAYSEMQAINWLA